MTLTWYRHFQRNGGLNQILKRQTSRSHYGSKAPVVAITVSKYRNKTGKTAVKAVPYPAKQTSKTLLRHTLIRKIYHSELSFESPSANGISIYPISIDQDSVGGSKT
jgi:hypothetical protein